MAEQALCFIHHHDGRMKGCSRKNILLFLSGCLIAALVLNIPLAIFGSVINWNDTSEVLLSRVAVAREFLSFGWCERFRLILSGINAAENGFDPKIDTLIFMALNPVSANFAFHLLRDFALVTSLTALLVLHYRVRPLLAISTGALASQGFNFLNWFFFGFDYFGAAFLFGYQFLPLLPLPALLVRNNPSLRLCLISFVISLLAGVLYAFSTAFALSVFVTPIVLLWVAGIVRSKNMAWPICGLLLGTCLLAIPDVINFVSSDDTVRLKVWEWQELLGVRKGIWLLSHRDWGSTRIGCILLLGALWAAARGGRLRDAAFLLGLYFIALLPDPVAKMVLGQLSFAPPIMLSINYYCYVVSPIFFCSALGIGFSALTKLWSRAVCVVFWLLALHMAWGKVAVEYRRPGIALDDLFTEPAIREVHSLLRGSAQRAALLTADVGSLEFFDFRVPRPIPIYLNSLQIPTSDGFASSMSYAYSVFWSNILRSKNAPTVFAPSVFRQAYLEIDMRDYMAQRQDGCFWQTKQVVLNQLNLDLLGLTATRYILSYLELDDTRLRLLKGRGDGPIVCGENRLLGGFSIYELRNVPTRVSIARAVEVLASEEDVLSKMRASGVFENAETVWLSESQSKEIAARNLFGSAGTVTVIRDTPDFLSVRVTADSQTVLLVRDSYTRKLRISINQKPANYVRANYVYVGIAIPSGISLVNIEQQ